jgi:hypothetical protein
MIASGEPGAEMEQEKVPNYGAPVARPTSFPQQFPPTETLSIFKIMCSNILKEPKEDQFKVQLRSNLNLLFRPNLRRRIYSNIDLERDSIDSIELSWKEFSKKMRIRTMLTTKIIMRRLQSRKNLFLLMRLLTRFTTVKILKNLLIF